jgi:hypothetical protein
MFVGARKSLEVVISTPIRARTGKRRPLLGTSPLCHHLLQKLRLISHLTAVRFEWVLRCGFALMCLVAHTTASTLPTWSHTIRRKSRMREGPPGMPRALYKSAIRDRHAVHLCRTLVGRWLLTESRIVGYLMGRYRV